MRRSAVVRHEVISGALRDAGGSEGGAKGAITPPPPQPEKLIFKKHYKNTSKAHTVNLIVIIKIFANTTHSKE